MEDKLIELWKLYGADNDLSYEEFVIWLGKGADKWFRGEYEKTTG